DVTAINTDGIESVQYQKPDDNNPITIRKITNNSQMDNYYYDNGDSSDIRHNIMFIPTRYLKGDQLDKFATRYSLLTESKDNIVENSKVQDPDLLFLDQFNNVLRSSKYQLLLDQDDIVKLHTSIKSNLLTILAGLSGTGKSRIIRAYTEALGIDKNSENRFKFISVKPYWQDDSD